MPLPDLSSAPTLVVDSVWIALRPLAAATATLCLLRGKLTWALFFLTLAAFLPFLSALLNLTVLQVTNPVLVILPAGGREIVHRVRPGLTGEILRVAAEALLGVGTALRYAFLHASLASRPTMLGDAFETPAPVSSQDVLSSTSEDWQALASATPTRRPLWVARAANSVLAAGVAAVAVLECTWRLAYLIASGTRSSFHAIYLSSFFLQIALLVAFAIRTSAFIANARRMIRPALIHHYSSTLLGMVLALAVNVTSVIQTGFSELAIGRLLAGFEMYTFLLGALILSFTAEYSEPKATLPKIKPIVKRASSFIGLQTPRTSTFYLSPPRVSITELTAPQSAARPESATRQPSMYLPTRGPSIRRTASVKEVRAWLRRSSIREDPEEQRLWIGNNADGGAAGIVTSTFISTSQTPLDAENTEPTALISVSQPLHRVGPQQQQVNIIMRSSQACPNDLALPQTNSASSVPPASPAQDISLSIAKLLMLRRGNKQAKEASSHSSSVSRRESLSRSSVNASPRNSGTPSDASYAGVTDFSFPQPPQRPMHLPMAALPRYLGQPMPAQARVTDDELFTYKPRSLQANSSSVDVTSFIEAGGNRSSGDTRGETLLASLIGPSHLRQLIRAADLNDNGSTTSTYSVDPTTPLRFNEDDAASSILDPPALQELEQAMVLKATIRRSNSTAHNAESPLEPIPPSGVDASVVGAVRLFPLSEATYCGERPEDRQRSLQQVLQGPSGRVRQARRGHLLSISRCPASRLPHDASFEM